MCKNYNKQSCQQFLYLDVLHPSWFWSSQFCIQIESRVGYHWLSNLNDPAAWNISKFFSWCQCNVVNIHQGSYLSPLQRYLHEAGIQYLVEFHKLVLFMKNQFLIWNRDIEPAGIWTRISETKSGYANHSATLHWPNGSAVLIIIAQ